MVNAAFIQSLSCAVSVVPPCPPIGSNKLSVDPAIYCSERARVTLHPHDFRSIVNITGVEAKCRLRIHCPNGILAERL